MRPAGRLRRMRWALPIAAASALMLGQVLVTSGAPPAVAPDGARAIAFDGDRAWRDIEALVAIGPRPAGSPGAERTRHYILEQLRQVGVVARAEPFEGRTPHGSLAMANVIATVPGRRPDAILIGGHYDTKWFGDLRFVGANDGGSSTALLLELARVLARAPREALEFTYWLTFFDGEEARLSWTPLDSLYGSRHLATKLARERRLPRAVIIVDMIGDRDLSIRREETSTPWLTEVVWTAARRRGHGAHFLLDTVRVQDDHLPFLRAGVPATLLIDFSYPPWHTEGDTLDKVSADSLRIVGEVVLEALPEIERRLLRGEEAR